MNIGENGQDIQDLVIYQLKNYWPNFNERIIKDVIPIALEEMEETFRGSAIKRLYNPNGMIFNEYYSVTWMIFLYRISNLLAKSGGVNREADMVYYLNKIMHAVDWYHQVELPIHFLAEHPLGSVLGRATYGDYLFIYQGTTVGGSRKGDKLYYPKFGDNVILYANATVLGNSIIGNNVIISANTYIINDLVPDNCIVFGKSPNLIIKTKDEEYIKEMSSHIWKW